MGVKYSENQKITTYSSSGEENGFLVPIFNENDNFLNNNDYLKQVYLTVVKPNNIKDLIYIIKETVFLHVLREILELLQKKIMNIKYSFQVKIIIIILF